MINAAFLNRVSGNISQDVCEILADLTEKVPDNGVILDLNCGKGRSTLSMSMALSERGNQNISILAVDTHVINPLSNSPLQDGSILKFLDNLVVYNSMRRVVPMIMPVPKVLEVLNRKCANLVVVQSYSSDVTSLNQYIDVAKFALRAKGTIAVCNPVDNLNFPEAIFKITYQSKGLLVYESFRKGEL